MAVLKNVVLAASVLIPLVAAVPMPGAEKRDIYTNTVIEIAWVTVEETTTIWVDPATSTPAPAPVAAASATSPVPAAIFAAATYTPPAPVAASSSSAPQAAYTPPAVPAPAPPASSSVPPAVPVASSPAPASSTSAVMVQARVTVGSDGDCEGADDACQGDVTYWTGGLGACGWNVDTNNDFEIALPYEFMGTLSNDNPYCGRSVTLYNPTSGTTVQATVGDKCMGCVDRSIDCTEALFNAITDGTGNGRVSGIEWYLN